jgi:hypothetical protein
MPKLSSEGLQKSSNDRAERTIAGKPADDQAS